MRVPDNPVSIPRSFISFPMVEVRFLPALHTLLYFDTLTFMNSPVRFLFGAALLVTLASTTSAQPRRGGPAQMPQGSVAGTIVDGAAGTPLPNTTIAVRSSADSTLVTGAIAERDGSFSIAGLRPGQYYARVSFVGYVVRLIDFTIEPGALNAQLGTIQLSTDSSLGSEVTVTARREFMSVGIDRTTYNTKDLIVSSGGNATDVLRNVPSIEVDPDGNVSLRGNQNVAIQINGRPMVMKGDALATFLRGLPADVVDRVEVVTNPSAKYDPEGMGGIINIVLNQQTSAGLSGGVNGAFGTTNNHNIGGNLAYGSGPFNLFGSYSFNYGTREGLGDRYRESSIAGTPPVLEQLSENKGKHPSHTLNLSADYTVAGAHLFSLSAVGQRRDGNGSSMVHTSERDLSNVPVYRYDRSTDEENEGTNLDYRFGYKWTLEPSRHELSVDARLNTDNSIERNAYRQSSLDPDGSGINDSLPKLQRTTEDNYLRTYSAQLDYVRQIGEGGRLEAGYKGDLERVGGDFFSESFDYGADLFRADDAFNYSFQYDRQIHAVYSTYGHDFGSIAAQVGVRLEQAYTTFDLTSQGEEFDNDYFSVFPSASLTYKPSEAMQLKATYSKRVQRPWIMALNPFSNPADPSFRHSGNPYLKPEYTDSYELSGFYFTDGASLTLTPFYRRTTDALRRWELVDSAGVSTLTFVNFDVNETYGADLIGTLRVGEWFNGFASASAWKTVTDAGNIQSDLGSEGFVWSLRANATVTLPYGIDVQTSVFYRAPMVIEGGEIGAWTMTDIAVQKRLFDNRARVGIRVSDPFKTMGFDVWRRDARYYQTFEHSWNSRGLFLTFNYSFGSSDRAPRRDRGQQNAPPPDMMGM